MGEGGSVSGSVSAPDQHGNVKRQEGVDRCYCGCKYWEDDRCIDCGGTEPDSEG